MTTAPDEDRMRSTLQSIANAFPEWNSERMKLIRSRARTALDYRGPEQTQVFENTLRSISTCFVDSDSILLGQVRAAALKGLRAQEKKG